MPDWDQVTAGKIGLVRNELSLTCNAFRALPQVKNKTHMHCVMRWSQLDMVWEGVLARDLIATAQPLPGAQFVTLHGYDGYTTNLPLRALLDDDVVIAHSVFGRPLAFEHGGPVRMVVPQRYAWKSAKWLKAIEFHDSGRPGFREQLGYHCRLVEGRALPLSCRRRRISSHHEIIRL